ncbi:YbaK/aminoacyl-tRNA synthetase-associated domain-containing protein [Fennellomyces sp. T-0311]|nr:YbaK/aminoacyl-tRNA synthetase-associated domain-containing protein [Fennellomyces sp. T-0311]
MIVSELPADQRALIENLQNDISALYKSFSNAYLVDWEEQAKEAELENAPDVVERVAQGCADSGIGSTSRLYEVETNYYDWPLQQRAFRVLAPSKEHMCKSVVMENRAYSESLGLSDDVYPRFICVMTQYTAPVNTEKLMKHIRDFSGRAAGKKYYNYRVAQTEKSLELTGFKKGGVCPIGMLTRIPIILAKSITNLDPPVFIMGAGHIDWKLGVPVDDFIRGTNCIVLDLD